MIPSAPRVELAQDVVAVGRHAVKLVVGAGQQVIHLGVEAVDDPQPAVRTVIVHVFRVAAGKSRDAHGGDNVVGCAQHTVTARRDLEDPPLAVIRIEDVAVGRVVAHACRLVREVDGRHGAQRALQRARQRGAEDILLCRKQRLDLVYFAIRYDQLVGSWAHRRRRLGPGLTATTAMFASCARGSTAC